MTITAKPSTPMAETAGEQPPSPSVRVATDTFDGLLNLGGFPSANLLPPAILTKREVRRAKRAAFYMVAVVLGLLAVLVAFTAMQQRAADEAKAQAQARVDAAIALKQQYSYVPAVYQAVSTARTDLATAMGQEVQVSRLLSGLASLQPPGVSLDTMTVTVGPAGDEALPADQVVLPGVGVVTFTGESRTMVGIAGWLDRVRTNPDYSAPVLNEVNSSEEGIYAFDAGADLSDQALSARYVRATE